MKRILSISILMMVALFSTAAVYEPSLTSDSEVCVFFEANSTVTDTPKLWASKLFHKNKAPRDVFYQHRQAGTSQL